MSDKLIQVGRVAGAFGVKGEVRVSTFTENPLAVLNYRTLLSEDGQPALTLLSGRSFNGGVIARAKEIETKEQADRMRGLKLFVARAALPPPEEDEFYLADLIGLAAVAPDGEPLGVVAGVETYGAGDLIEIKPPSSAPNWQIAFTRDNVPEIHLAGGRIVVVRPNEVGDIGDEGRSDD